MRVIMQFKPRPGDLGRLRLYVHGAPHYRQCRKHPEVLEQYRRELVKAANAAGVALPIVEPIDLYVLFIDPCSPDSGNLHLALTAAMDGRVLADDSLVAWISGMGCYFPNPPNKGDRPFRRSHN